MMNEQIDGRMGESPAVGETTKMYDWTLGFADQKQGGYRLVPQHGGMP